MKKHKLISILIIAALGWQNAGWPGSGFLRPLAVEERRGAGVVELILGPNPRSPRTLEDVRRMTVQITDWLIAEGYQNSWFLVGYRNAFSTAKLVDDKNLLMGKGIDIDRNFGTVSAPYLMIGNDALRYFDISNISPDTFGIVATIVVGEAIGLAVHSITYSDINGLFQRVFACVSDSDIYHFRRMLDIFQGGRVTSARFKQLDELVELEAFLQKKEGQLLDRVAELISGEYIEMRERGRMVEWLCAKKLIDDSIVPFLDSHDRWLYERRNDGIGLLALTLAYIGRDRFVTFIAERPDVVKYDLNTRIYGFFILHQILTWIKSGGRDGLDPAMAGVMLRGRTMSIESIDKFLPCAKLVAERVFKKADEIDRKLAELGERMELLRCVNDAGLQKIDSLTLQRVLGVTAIMQDAELTPAATLYFKITLVNYGLGPLLFSDRQIEILQKYEWERRQSRRAARQTLEGI